METGAIVRSLREALGMKQKALAALSGMDPWKVSKIENGRNACESYRTRVELAAGFGLALEEVDALLAGKLTVLRAAALIQDRAAQAASASS